MSQKRWDPPPREFADAPQRRADTDAPPRDNKFESNTERRPVTTNHGRFDRQFSKRGENMNSDRGTRGEYHSDESRDMYRRKGSQADGWFCEECKKENRNLEGTAFCSFCGAPRAGRHRNERNHSHLYSGEHSRSGGRREERQSDKYSYYGAASFSDSRKADDGYKRRPREDVRDRGPRRKMRDCDRDRKRPDPTEWPPAFDKAGAAYVFDARSGFFYEAVSDFFYDPKTKLYYGNKKKAYFQHVPGQNPPFQPMQQQQQKQQEQGSESVGTVANVSDVKEGNSEGGNVGVVSNETKSSPDVNVQTKKFSISIGKISKKPLSSTEKPAVVEVGTIGRKVVTMDSSSTVSEETKESSQTEIATTTVSKVHASNMDKWSKRDKEKLDETIANQESPLENTSAKKVSTTADGKPVCLLCKRKFPTFEKLKQHEEKSALHKENLRKKEEASEGIVSAPKAVYRDRAKERRQIFGTNSKSSKKGPSLPTTSQQQERVSESVSPQVTLDSSNVGNKMLQKLGWKEGKSLGRQSDDSGGSYMNEQLKKDWEKIEGLAATGNGSLTYRERSSAEAARGAGVGA